MAAADPPVSCDVFPARPEYTPSYECPTEEDYRGGPPIEHYPATGAPTPAPTVTPCATCSGPTGPCAALYGACMSDDTGACPTLLGAMTADGAGLAEKLQFQANALGGAVSACVTCACGEVRADESEPDPTARARAHACMRELPR